MSTAISKEQRAAALSVCSKTRLPWNEEIHKEFGVDQFKWRALVETKFAAAQSVETVVLALAYCKARNFDPMKGMMHIVPVYDKALKKMVDTIWPAIGELRATAFRTGQYAGRCETVYGQDMTEKLGGVDMTFPEWAQVTVKRLVGGVAVEFAGPRAYWIESYSTAGRDTDAPNDMWKNRPRGQLEKCAEAAALRAAFPEEVGNEYCSDEIRTYERGGVVIDPPQTSKPKMLGELAAESPALPSPQITPEMQTAFDKAIKGLERASEPKHIEWFDKNITDDVFNSWTDDMQKLYTEKKQQAIASMKPETTEQAFQRCLAEIAGMDAKAALEHIKTHHDTENWTMDMSRKMDDVLEGKAK